jgi:hypothetical protein
MTTEIRHQRQGKTVCFIEKVNEDDFRVFVDADGMTPIGMQLNAKAAHFVATTLAEMNDEYPATKVNIQAAADLLRRAWAPSLSEVDAIYAVRAVLHAAGVKW